MAYLSKVKAIDVAQYIINKFHKRNESITTLKLQKLLYYVQAWSLVWDDAPMFDEDFEAWINGPVVRALFNKLRGFYYCPLTIDGADVNQLNDNQKDTIDHVLQGYGNLSSVDLVYNTHHERPWKEARAGLPDNIKCTNIITKQSMLEFYSEQYQSVLDNNVQEA